MLPRSVGAVVKDQKLITLSPLATVREAAKAMADYGIGAVPVLRNDRLIGIFSERDLLSRIAALGRDLDRTRLADVMTANPTTIDEGTPVVKALEVMLDGGFRHLPVTRAGRPVGILSFRDIPAEYWIIRQNWKSPQRAPGNDSRAVAAPQRPFSGTPA